MWAGNDKMQNIFMYKLEVKFEIVRKLFLTRKIAKTNKLNVTFKVYIINITLF